MCHNGNMKKASIRDLHMRTGALVQEAADGEVIIIEKRGVPGAELGPPPVAHAYGERESGGHLRPVGMSIKCPHDFIMNNHIFCGCPRAAAHHTTNRPQ